MTPVNDAALDTLFREAHTCSAWQDKPIDNALLHELYELVRLGPTSLNCCPARFVFVRSAEAKERLKGCLSEGNVAKTMAAPVTVIVAQDLEFYEALPRLFPQIDARPWFAGKPAFAETTALRNSSLQGAYLIVVARALGLDTGPMSGFDGAKVDAAFFAGSTWKSNFLVNLGYGEPGKTHPRNPRLSFDEAARIA